MGLMVMLLHINQIILQPHIHHKPVLIQILQKQDIHKQILLTKLNLLILNKDIHNKYIINHKQGDIHNQEVILNHKQEDMVNHSLEITININLDMDNHNQVVIINHIPMNTINLSQEDIMLLNHMHNLNKIMLKLLLHIQIINNKVVYQHMHHLIHLIKIMYHLTLVEDINTISIINIESL